MSNFCVTSQSASSLRAPNSYGAEIADQRNEGISFDLTLRLYELELQNDLLKEENERLLALEKEYHDQRRLLYERETVIIKQKADGVFLEETVRMLKEMYETLREGSERSDKNWKDLLEIKQKCCRLEFDKKKLEMDLRRGAGRIAESTEQIELLLEEKDVTISEMAKKIENLEKKVKLGEEFGEQVVEFLKLLQEYAHCTVSDEVTRIAIDAFGSNFQHKGTENSERSGPKSVGISPAIYPNMDSIEADEQLTGPVIEKKPCTPNTTDANFIETSDDEEEVEEEEKEKQIPSFASPSSAKLVPATKRKPEEATWSEEKQDEAAKRCRSNGPNDGKLWQDVKQMKSNDELSMESVCALNVMNPPITRDSRTTLVYRRRGKGINSN